MRLEIIHETRYSYQPAVDTSKHVVHLRPRDGLRQKVLSFALDVEPHPVSRGHDVDSFGNPRCFFSLSSRHDALAISARTEVETWATDAKAGVSAMPWESVRNLFRFHKHASWDETTEFVFPSRYALVHDDFRDYAAIDFTPGRPLVAATVALMQRLHRDMRYVSESTDIHTPARDALKRRVGVCQDFAHILISCLRTFGVPARYVSGYLLTNPPPGQTRLIGADASHAWVSMYLPSADGEGANWIDLDPTNDRWAVGSPGEDYVVLAVGRDYADVSPVRGVIHGASRHLMSVAVTVKPMPERA